ncbi:hypothetical protein CNYM01_09478 [Colletotrichum nymphaeae SA-01]|uniref:Uncharacterized protein n=1 Tax=Colletotrichum nymphaeae SA-01 TaxID=1460502 RepID=A0A135T910_9PEZI|nr:hypothetical protein CNYM01_09478 [Colletotrichum nymphaeae SA-01]
MILPQIPPRIRSLHNHPLPRHRAARERQLVARAAPLRLRPARDPHGGEAVGQVVRDGPGRLGAAHVGSAAARVAPAARGAAVRQGVVVAVAGRHGAGGEGGGGDLAGPGAGGFAAVPVAGCRACACGLGLYLVGEEDGEEEG